MNEQPETKPEIIIGIWRSCDACGRERQDPDEFYCDDCKTKGDNLEGRQ